MSHGVLAPVVSDSPQQIGRLALLGSVMDPKTVNFSQVRKWPRNCELLHANVYKTPLTSLLDFFEVPQLRRDGNCSDGNSAIGHRILRFELRMGLPNPNTDTDDTSSSYRTSLLCSKLPQVIQDTIKVVKNLGKEGRRYL